MILPGEIDLGCPVNFDSPLTDRLAAFWTGIPGLDALPAVPDAALRYPAAVTASPTVVTDRFGFTGRTYNGSSQYANAGADLLAAVATTPFTVAAVITHPASAGASSQFAIAKDWHTGSRGWGVGVSSTGQLYAETDGALRLSSVGPVMTGTGTDVPWLIALSYDGGATGLWEGSVNGAQIGSWSNGAAASNTSPLYLGGRAYSGYFNGFNGSVWAAWAWSGRYMTLAELSRVFDEWQNGYPTLLRRTSNTRWLTPVSPPPPPAAAPYLPAFAPGFGW